MRVRSRAVRRVPHALAGYREGRSLICRHVPAWWCALPVPMSRFPEDDRPPQRRFEEDDRWRDRDDRRDR